MKDTSGNDIGSISRANMTKQGSDLFGVAEGKNPLEVLVPSMLTRSIRQSTPATDANNTLTVTFKSNYHLESASTITITGLTGSQTNSGNLALTSNQGTIWGTAGSWTKNTGSLVLTVASGRRMDANGNYHVSFNLINSAEDQPSPQVSVQAQVLDSSGNAIGSIASAAMIKPGTTVFGVADGANPLEVVVPTFSIKTIQQSTPVPSRNNTITVTLKANYDLPDTSTVTIKGLTGSITDDSASLNITSTDNR